MCVDVPGGSTAAGAELRLTRCHGYASDGAPQRWRFLGGRFQKVSNTNSGLCIGFPHGGSPVTGARLVQERCDQVPAWQLVPQGRDGTDPLSMLETSGPGGPALCMAAAGLGGASATPLVALPCAGFQDAGQLLELG
jgi:Ricin-type beta-trefoil lectin domain